MTCSHTNCRKHTVFGVLSRAVNKLAEAWGKKFSHGAPYHEIPKNERLTIEILASSWAPLNFPGSKAWVLKLFSLFL